MEKSGEKPCRIAITGPESTGKSFLAEQLARHYRTNYNPEYARKYLDNLNRPYCFEDLDKIADGQWKEEEDAALTSNKILFCDTEFTVLKIWSLHKYKTCSELILNYYNNQKYDLYLLCNIDLPWQFDPLREHPDLRQYFFDWFERDLQQRKVKYMIISGQGQLRKDLAIRNIDKFIKDNPLIYL